MNSFDPGRFIRATRSTLLHTTSAVAWAAARMWHALFLRAECKILQPGQGHKSIPYTDDQFRGDQ